MTRVDGGIAVRRSPGKAAAGWRPIKTVLLIPNRHGATTGGVRGRIARPVANLAAVLREAADLLFRKHGSWTG